MKIRYIKVEAEVKFRAAGITFATWRKTQLVPIPDGDHELLHVDEKGVKLTLSMVSKELG